MNERILLVDDEEATLAVISDLLQVSGYRVETSRTGHEALTAFTRDPSAFDLVISDLYMEQMSGIALAESLLQARPGTPIVILTGDKEQALIEAQGLAIRGFVQKPVTVEQLVDSIGRALSQPGAA